MHIKYETHGALQQEKYTTFEFKHCDIHDSAECFLQQAASPPNLSDNTATHDEVCTEKEITRKLNYAYNYKSFSKLVLRQEHP